MMNAGEHVPKAICTQVIGGSAERFPGHWRAQELTRFGQMQVTLADIYELSSAAHCQDTFHRLMNLAHSQNEFHRPMSSQAS